MKRKLNGKVRLSISIFAIVIAIFAGGLVFLANNFSKVEKGQIQISPDTRVYDKTNSPIIIGEDASIVKTWNDSFVIKADGKRSTSIGSHTIATKKGHIYIIGGGYRILPDASVVKLDDFYETTTDETQFYKLADRKYLLVSPEITDDNSELKTLKYVYIVMDKQGNAQLINDDMFTKTLIPAILHGSDYTFDIGRELLTIGTMKVNMKDVIGSTNEYNPLLYVDNNSKYKDEDFVNPEEVDIKVTGGAGGAGGTGGTGGIGGQGGTGGKGSNAEQSDIIKEITLLGVERFSTELKVRYHAVDPFAQYGLIFIAVYDIDTDLSIEANRRDKVLEGHMYGVNTYNNSLNIANLKPDTYYQVAIGHISSDDDIYIDDIIKTSTNGVNSSIKLVSQDKNTVSLNIKLDKYYNSYTYGKVEAYYYSSTVGSDGSCSLNPARLINDKVFSIKDTIGNNGLYLTLGDNANPISPDSTSSEKFLFKVYLSNDQSFQSNVYELMSEYATNGYYDGTSCASKYKIEVSDGFAQVVSKAEVQGGKDYILPPKLSLTGWGLTFDGWMIGDAFRQYPNTSIKVGPTYVATGDNKFTIRVKAKWKCPTNASLGNYECTCNQGYEKTGSGSTAACQLSTSTTSAVEAGE